METPPGRLLLRAVHILLECILVLFAFRGFFGKGCLFCIICTTREARMVKFDIFTTQCLRFIDDEDFGLVESCLVFSAHLCVKEENCFKFLYHDAMSKIVDILDNDYDVQVFEAAALAIHKVHFVFHICIPWILLVTSSVKPRTRLNKAISFAVYFLISLIKSLTQELNVC